MQSLSKRNIVDKLQFVEAQSVFILETTAKVKTYNDFLMSHEYFSIDPNVIFATIKTRIHTLLDDVRQILSDIDAGLRDTAFESIKS